MKYTLTFVTFALGALLAGSFVSAAQATNRGKHIVGGFGSHHRGGHMVGHHSNRGMHIVGGHGHHHKGGHMVR